ncbi:MAG: lipoate--protein ligase [Clostridiaceae bacterium]|nr:lipoate--protein ligase [Clostridiaceae bacterium]
MSRIFVSTETDPYFNIAAEYQLFLEAVDEPQLFLWQNNRAVIMGRNQSFSAECDMEFLQKHHIKLARRFSGGGSVFHDLGNVNFTFLSTEAAAEPDRYLKVIKNAIEFCGVQCDFSSRNDLVTDGKKFSGHAYYTDHGKYMYHGTIMISVDFELLSGALHPSYLKLHSKGIDSVKSRVINLSEINREITTEGIMRACITAFRQEYAAGGIVEYLGGRQMRPEALDMLRSESWIYGQSPDYEIEIEKKLSFGNVTINSDVTDGRITRIKIYTDGLAPISFAECEKELSGEIFHEAVIVQKIEKWYSTCYNRFALTRFMPIGL